MDREKCFECPHFDRGSCRLMCKASIYNFSKCILDYDFVKKIEKNSLDEFVFYNNPIIYFQFLGQNKEIPNIGDKVLTLKGGFGSTSSGKILEVYSMDSIQLFLKDTYPSNHKYVVSFVDWNLRLFNLTENKEDV